MNKEELRKAQMAKKSKQAKESKPDVSEIQADDIMLVLHKDEASLIESLLFDVLEKDSSAVKIHPNEKRLALDALKHMGAI